MRLAYLLNFVLSLGGLLLASTILIVWQFLKPRSRLAPRALLIVVLAYSGITFKTPGKPVEFLGLHIETTDSHFIPPVVGALALVGGIVLLVVKPRQV